MKIFSVAFEGNKPLTAYPKLAKQAEAHGFHSFQIYEHLPYKPAWPIAFLAGMETKRILVGPVTVPVFLHRPLSLARNLKALSELTHGRAILGISRGAYSENIPEPVDRSIRSVLKTIDIITRQIRDLPKGLMPELYVGTSGPKLALQAGQLSAVRGIVVDNLWNPRYAKQLRRILDEARQKSRGRDVVSLIARPFTMQSKTKEEAIKRLDPILKSYLPNLVGDSPMLRSSGLSYKDLLKACRGKRTLPTELIENFAATGTPKEIADQVELMLKAGVNEVCFGHPLGPNPSTAMGLLAHHVVSRFS